ncbi:VanZ family protein [Candidatus Bipolaricaulota bacterium]|nr:VanZ family protein [Candidatus Bipolaricaulota bacterium]
MAFKELSAETLKKAFWTTIFLAYAGLVFYSLVSPIGKGAPLVSLPGIDKLIHAVEFGLFALIAYWTLGYYSQKGGRSKTVITTSLLYGGITELSQHFIPYRTASFLDLAADFFGIIAGLAVMVIANKYFRARSNQGERDG